MYSSINKDGIAGNKTFTKVLLALSVLLLVLSCPIKRFFQLNTLSSVGIQKTERQKAKVNSGVQYNSGCSAQERTVPANQNELNSYSKQDQNFFGNSNVQPGFDINYFLSRIKKADHSSDVSFTSSLPLFLQKRSLLI